MNTMTKTEKRPVAEEQPRERGYITPRVDITETKDGYLLEAEMPGVSKDGLEVLLEGSELTLIGRRSFQLPNSQLLYRESTDRDYRRVFVLDPTIDTTKVDAKMEDGVLRLHLPKAESVKPRKIKISG
jgi:HSP20 family protein